MEPSTEWSEIVEPDEGDRYAQAEEQIAEIQKKNDKKFGPGRAFHRKQILGLHASLEVFEGPPPFAHHGLFARPGAYETLVRLSNGGFGVASDVIPDVRGFACSVRGVSGDGALNRKTDRQDFLFLNRPTFGFVNSADFFAIVAASSGGQPAILRALIDRHGPVGGPLEAAKLSKDEQSRYDTLLQFAAVELEGTTRK